MYAPTLLLVFGFAIQCTKTSRKKTSCAFFAGLSNLLDIIDEIKSPATLLNVFDIVVGKDRMENYKLRCPINVIKMMCKSSRVVYLFTFYRNLSCYVVNTDINFVFRKWFICNCYIVVQGMHSVVAFVCLSVCLPVPPKFKIQ